MTVYVRTLEAGNDGENTPHPRVQRKQSSVPSPIWLLTNPLGRNTEPSNQHPTRPTRTIIMTSPNRCTSSTDTADDLAALVAHRYQSLEVLSRREGYGSYPAAVAPSSDTTATAPSPPGGSLGETRALQVQQQIQQQECPPGQLHAAKLEKFLAVLREAIDLVNEDDDGDDWL
jgi:hypothetical protein